MRKVNKSAIVDFVLWFQPYFHRFTLVCAISFLFWRISTYEPETPNIVWVLEVLTPEFWEQFEGTTPLAPIDFVH